MILTPGDLHLRAGIPPPASFIAGHQMVTTAALCALTARAKPGAAQLTNACLRILCYIGRGTGPDYDNPRVPTMRPLYRLQDL